MSIDQISAELFAARPGKTLFHYSSIAALDGITEAKGLFATDIHYFNDAAELRHFMHLLHADIARRLENSSQDQDVLQQFREWTSDRLPDGNMVFVTSFTENGNLLSQWRGYCPAGKGVSIGFGPDLVTRCANEQAFRLGRCIYDLGRQQQVVARVLDEVLKLARERGGAGPREKHPTQSFHKAFEEIEDALLQIGALMKHPSFKEEEEWRAVSPIMANYVEAPIKYREGASMLIPYVIFSLRDGGNDWLRFAHVIVGPTPNRNLSMNSVSRFLAKRSSGQLSVEYCGVPFRAW
jgi:hypothetical protein